MQQTGLQELVHDHRHAAGLVHVGHDETSGRPEVGQVRGAVADLVEVIDGQRHVGLVGYGQQVQHRVGGAAHGHDYGDCVLEGLARHDVPRIDALVQQVVDDLTGAHRHVLVSRVHSRNGSRAWYGHAHGLDGRRHCVGGKHAGACALARAGHALHGNQVFEAQVASGECAASLEHVLNVDVVALEVARQYGAAVEKERRHVEAGDGHHGAWHVLVACRHDYQGVHALAKRHRLDGVGDDLAADQRCLHTLGAHGDSIANGNGAEQERHALGVPDALLDLLGKPVQVHVAGRHVACQVGHRHERFLEIVVLKAYRTQHGAGRRPVCPVDDYLALMPQVLFRHSCH